MRSMRSFWLGLALILVAGHLLDGVESTRVLHGWVDDLKKGKAPNPLPSLPTPSLPKLPNLPAKLDPVKGVQQIATKVGNPFDGGSGGTFSGTPSIRTGSVFGASGSGTPKLPNLPAKLDPVKGVQQIAKKVGNPFDGGSGGTFTPGNSIPKVPAKLDPVKGAQQVAAKVGNPFDGGSGGALQKGVQTATTNWQAVQKQATQIQDTVGNLQAQGAKIQDAVNTIKAEGTKFGDDPEGYVVDAAKREVTSKVQDAITKALPACSCSDFETDKWDQRHALEQRFCHQQPCSLNGGCCGGVRYAKQEGGEEALQIGAESVAACVACTGGCAACGAAAAATAIQEELEAQLKSIVKALTDTVSDIATAGQNMAGDMENELREVISTLAAKVTSGSGVNLGDMQNDAASALPLKSMPKCRFAIEPGKFTFHSRTCVYCCNCVKNLDAVQFYLAWRLDCR